MEFESVRAPLEEVVAWMVENVRIRKGFAELARRHRPLIVSSSFHELIEPVLDREGLDLDVVANRIDSRPDGWRARFRNADPCLVCGQPCKRADIAVWRVRVRGRRLLGPPLALAATRVFARDGLADYLEARGVPFEPFEDFHDVTRAL